MNSEPDRKSKGKSMGPDSNTAIPIARPEHIHFSTAVAVATNHRRPRTRGLLRERTYYYKAPLSEVEGTPVTEPVFVYPPYFIESGLN